MSDAADRRFLRTSLLLDGPVAAVLTEAGRALREKCRRDGIYFSTDVANLFAEIEQIAESAGISVSSVSSAPTRDSVPQHGQTGTLEFVNATQVGDRLGRSAKWAKRHAVDLGGELHEGAWRFPVAAVEAFATSQS